MREGGDEQPSGPGCSAIAWRVHPAGERRLVGLMVLAVILVMSVAAGFWMGGAYWSVFAFGVLFLSLEAFFLPSRFELSEDGVRVKKAFSEVLRPWEHFRRVLFDNGGVTLSPFSRRHWLDAYRAIRVRYPAGASPAAAEVRRFVLAHVDRGAVLIEGLPAAGAPGGEGQGEDA